jgi:hypothetical protein
MLKPEVCEDLKTEAKPRISVSALFDACKLIRTQGSAVADNSHTCAESATGGRDAQEGKSVIRQCRLHFEDNELWVTLPEAVQESCRSLWRELLAIVLKKDERRQHEREDQE